MLIQNPRFCGHIIYDINILYLVSWETAFPVSAAAKIVNPFSSARGVAGSPAMADPATVEIVDRDTRPTVYIIIH